MSRKNEIAKSQFILMITQKYYYVPFEALSDQEAYDFLLINSGIRKSNICPFTPTFVPLGSPCIEFYFSSSYN